MPYIKAFIGGFFATLVFHQGALALLYLADPTLSAPYNMAATAPLGIPAVISLALWGGVWGVPIWWLIRNLQSFVYWLVAAAAGAVGPTAVAMLVVFPLKGLTVGGVIVVGALLLNAAWGIGLALFMRLFHSEGFKPEMP